MVVSGERTRLPSAYNPELRWLKVCDRRCTLMISSGQLLLVYILLGKITCSMPTRQQWKKKTTRSLFSCISHRPACK